MLVWLLHTSTWISHGCTCVPSLLKLPPTSTLSHPSRLLQSPGLNSSSHTANFNWLSILHVVVYMLPPYSMVQLSHPYMTTGKTKALITGTFVGKVMSLLFNTLFRFVISQDSGRNINNLSLHMILLWWDRTRGTKEPLDKGERGEWKSWFETQHSKTEDHGSRSHHIMANRRGKME